MGVVMAGLILVQAYWISNAMRIKEQQFNQLVGRSMTDICSEIERREAGYRIMDEFRPFLWPESSIQQGFDFNASANINLDPDNGNVDFDQEIKYYNRSEKGGYTSYLRNDSVIIIYDNPEVKPDTLNINELPEEDQGVIRDMQKQLSSRQDFFNDIITKMMSPYLPIEKRIDTEILKNILEEEFKQREINLGFEYAIVKQNNEIAIKSPGYNPRRDAEIFSARLFPEDIFALPNYLLVYFPGQKNYVFSSVGFMGISSGFLILIIIGLFIITLYVIFRQKKLSEIKSDFVNNMTHELKTPISTISLASQMLSDEGIPVESKNISSISHIIDTESKRLGYQVEKVLQMAIFDQGKIKIKEKRLDMHELIQSVCSNFDILINKSGGELKRRFNASCTIVRVDEVHFTNVISNLLDNATKYCREVPDITVGTRNEGDYLVIMVEDKGIGISRGDQKQIFEKFYRVSTGNVHNVKGFGLGLSYVKMIVELHQGYIKLKSELNKGSRFEVFVLLNDEN